MAGTVPGSDPNIWMPLALVGPQGSQDPPGTGTGATEDIVIGTDTLHFVNGQYVGKN
jgi:hypothetical protein